MPSSCSSPNPAWITPPRIVEFKSEFCSDFPADSPMKNNQSNKITIRWHIVRCGGILCLWKIRLPSVFNHKKSIIVSLISANNGWCTLLIVGFGLDSIFSGWIMLETGHRRHVALLRNNHIISNTWYCIDSKFYCRPLFKTRDQIQASSFIQKHDTPVESPLWIM